MNYEEGDRIILNLTHHSRFLWFTEENKYIQVVPYFTWIKEESNLIEFLQKQAIQRAVNVDLNGYLKTTYFKFIDYLLKKHSNYNPIVWGPFDDINLHFSKM